MSCTFQFWPLYVIEQKSIDFISTASGQMSILFLGSFHVNLVPIVQWCHSD